MVVQCKNLNINNNNREKIVLRLFLCGIFLQKLLRIVAKNIIIVHSYSCAHLTEHNFGKAIDIKRRQIL